MKQIFQELSTGKCTVYDIPLPSNKKGYLLIETQISLISAGTEKMLLDFGKSNLIEKAKMQPDRVQDVIDKIKTDGLISTYESVQRKLNEPIPLGYSNVGMVVQVGEGVTNFKVGDRVLSNGAHAEIVSVPQNLCCKIPREVNNAEASFTVLGSIALQGIRLAKPTFGETFLVIGLGLIGNLTAQLLKANGCNVIGLELDDERCQLAKSIGINTLKYSSDINPAEFCKKFNNGNGIDGVIITASTPSNDPVTLAAEICRQRGRIIMIGVTGMNLRRDLFYKKEISFQVSCSYGPGRYDELYEKEGYDYPFGLVRWTEKRNFEAILTSIKKKELDLVSLISHEFKFKDVIEAYELLCSNKKSMGIILKYPKFNVESHSKSIYHFDENKNHKPLNKPIVSFIGSGNYARNILIPLFFKNKTKFYGLASNDGSKFITLRKYKFQELTSDAERLVEKKNYNTVVIATRHNSHSDYVIKSLKMGKNIFVEKPLCINKEQLKLINESYTKARINASKKGIRSPIIMVGFNRRFSPLVIEVKKLLEKLDSNKSFIYTINSNFKDKNHWIFDKEIGGGLFIGEACHFVDLLRFLAGCKIENLSVNFSDEKIYYAQNFIINISFQDGSIGCINYFTNGNISFPKERLEIFSQNKCIQIDNFRKVKTWGFNFKTNKLLRQDKGQDNCIKCFIDSIKNNNNSPIPFGEILEVHNIMFEAFEQC